MVMLERGDQAAGHAGHVRDLHAVAVDAYHALLRAGPDHALRINADRADVAARHAIGGRVVVAQLAVAAEPVDTIAECSHPQVTIGPLRQAQHRRCLAAAVVQRHRPETAIGGLQVKPAGTADPQLAVAVLQHRAHVVATEPVALGVAAEQCLAQAVQAAIGTHPDAAFGILAQADHASARQVQAGRQPLQAVPGDAQQPLVLGAQPQVAVPVLQHRGHVQLAGQAVHQHQPIVLHPVQALTGDDPQRAVRRAVRPRQASAGAQPPRRRRPLEYTVVVAQHQPVERADPDPVLRINHQPGEAHRHRQVGRRRPVDDARVRRQIADALAFVQQPQPALAVHLHGLDQHLRRIRLVLPDPPLAITAAVADIAARVADPQPALAVDEQRADAVVAQARARAAVEHGEIQAVVAHQPFPGGEPQMALRRLCDVAQRVVRQAIARGPYVDGVVAQRRCALLRSQWQRQGQQQP